MEKLVFSTRRFDDWTCDAVIDLTQSQSAINQGKVETAGSDPLGRRGRPPAASEEQQAVSFLLQRAKLDVGGVPPTSKKSIKCVIIGRFSEARRTRYVRVPEPILHKTQPRARVQ